MRSSNSSNREIAEALLELGRSIPPSVLFPTVVAEAQGFALNDPYAFALATCLDRGTRAEIIWTIPYDLQREWGHLDPHRIRWLPLSELEYAFSRLPRKPRYINDAPKTLAQLTAIVVDELEGDASRLWTGRSARDVRRMFMRIHGVGPGIASMGVLLVEAAFGIRFLDMDRPRMDIKPDVNTMRVLYRLGVSPVQSESAALMAARGLNPPFPGGLDAPLWFVGREYCHPAKPDCYSCPLTHACRKVGA